MPLLEATRLERLQQYQILDTESEAAFDGLTQLAAHLCQTPMATITLVDAERQWFKSGVGGEFTETPLDVGFCPLVVQQETTLIIPDTLADARYGNNPAVSRSGVRFYAGVPLRTSDGYILGTLCVLDFVPRQLSPEQIQSLEILSRQVMLQLDQRLAVRKAFQLDKALLEVTQGISIAVGETFFSSLVRSLSKALSVEYAYISQLCPDNPEIATTLALSVDGQIIDNVEYELKATPCKEVIAQRKLCCYPRDVQTLFPDAYLLDMWRVESYVAIPLISSTGIPLGILGVLDCNPLNDVFLVESLLRIFAIRAVTELERQQMEFDETTSYSQAIAKHNQIFG